MLDLGTLGLTEIVRLQNQLQLEWTCGQPGAKGEDTAKGSCRWLFMSGM